MNQKTLLLNIFLFAVISPHLYCQINTVNKGSVEIVVKGKLMVEKGFPTIVAGALQPFPLTEDQKGLQSIRCSFDRGDLVLDYTLEPVQDGEYYVLNLPRAQIGDDEIRPFLRELSGNYQKITPGPGTGKQIRWTGFLEKYFDDNLDIQLFVSATYYGIPATVVEIDCSNPPKFGMKQQWPHLVAAGAGLAAIGIGQIFNNQSKNIYNKNYTGQVSAADAAPYYQDANDKHHQYLVLTYTGLGILTVDALWYFTRSIIYRKKLKTFRKNCEPNTLSYFRVEPYMDRCLNPSGKIMGVSFCYTF